MSNLAGRTCVEHQAEAVWQSPRQSVWLAGGWFCGQTYEPLVEDEQADLRHTVTPLDTVKDQCYAAAEALYHLLGGKAAGITPQCFRLPQHLVTGPFKCHWVLLMPDGKILDPTADQFLPERVTYKNAKGKGFLTKHPSGKAQRLLDIIEERDL